MLEWRDFLQLEGDAVGDREMGVLDNTLRPTRRSDAGRLPGGLPLMRAKSEFAASGFTIDSLIEPGTNTRVCQSMNQWRSEAFSSLQARGTNYRAPRQLFYSGAAQCSVVIPSGGLLFRS